MTCVLLEFVFALSIVAKKSSMKRVQRKKRPVERKKRNGS